LVDDYSKQGEIEKLVFPQEISQNRVGYFRGAVTPKTTTNGHVVKLGAQQYASLYREEAEDENTNRCIEVDRQPDMQNIYLRLLKDASTDL